MPAAVSIDVANLRQFQQAIADYASATGKTLEYSALRAARNWVIQGSRKFRKFGKDAKPINLNDGSENACYLTAYRLRKLSEKGLIPVVTDQQGARGVHYVKGKRRRFSAMSRGAKYYTRDYARAYAKKATRYPYSRRGFVRVLPWKITTRLDVELAARGELRAGRKATPPPARKRHAGVIAMRFDPATKRLTLSVAAIYDYKTGTTLAGKEIGPSVREMNKDMAACMAQALPAVIRDIQTYAARKLRERAEKGGAK